MDRIILRSIIRSAPRAIAGSLAVFLAIVSAGHAIAQMGFAAPAIETASGDEPPSTPTNFAFLKASSRVVESIDDFRRYSAKKSWELAFHALDSIEESGNTGTVPAGDGLLVPVRVRVQQLLLSLPPEGRDAYRLFNDAGAKQLWEHVQDTASKMQPDEPGALRKLVDRYFLTSVGDLAADRLGDALFEQSDFSGAEANWRLVVEKYPDPHVSLAKLQCKRCVALSLLGRRDAVASLAAQVREKYGDQNVTIGGRDLNTAEFAESLIAKTPAAAPLGPTHGKIVTDELVLPDADEPIWQIRIAGPDLTGQTDPMYGWPISKSSFPTVPFGAVDPKHFYANRLGVVFAADLETGKMLWRTDKFIGFSQQAVQILQQGIPPNAFFVVPAGDRLLAGCIGSKNMLGQMKQINNDNEWHMDCLDIATGKTVWSWRRAGFWLLSQPYVIGDLIYAVGISSNNSMHLLCMRMENGNTIWLTSLGTPQNVRNWRGGFNFGGPSLTVVGNEMYVSSNSGALFAVNISTHQIDWALQHDTKLGEAENGVVWWGRQIASTTPSSALLNDDGMFYLKDGSAETLYALDLAAPATKWKRLVSSQDSFVAIDGQTGYLLGNELSALDLQSRDLRWSTKLPDDAAPGRPIFCPKHVFVPTARGVFDIDPSDGDVRRIFHGADRAGGACQLILSGDKLVVVSDDAMTAYPIERATAGKISLRTLK